MGHGGEAALPLVVVRALMRGAGGSSSMVMSPHCCCCCERSASHHCHAIIAYHCRTSCCVVTRVCRRCIVSLSSTVVKIVSCRRRLLVGWVRLGWLGWGCSPIDEKNNESVIV